MGILSTSSQQELAASFVEMMLSPTVQDSYLSDGFPVNGSSLEKLVRETLTSEDGTVESDMGFLDLCGTLDTPILTDQVVKEAVLDQISGLLSGSLTPEDAAAAVVEKVSLYLAESRQKAAVRQMPDGRFLFVLRFPGCHSRPQASPDWRNRRR